MACQGMGTFSQDAVPTIYRGDKSKFREKIFFTQN